MMCFYPPLITSFCTCCHLSPRSHLFPVAMYSVAEVKKLFFSQKNSNGFFFFFFFFLTVGIIIFFFSSSTSSSFFLLLCQLPFSIPFCPISACLSHISLSTNQAFDFLFKIKEKKRKKPRNPKSPPILDQATLQHILTP